MDRMTNNNHSSERVSQHIQPVSHPDCDVRRGQDFGDASLEAKLVVCNSLPVFLRDMLRNNKVLILYCTPTMQPQIL